MGSSLQRVDVEERTAGPQQSPWLADQHMALRPKRPEKAHFGEGRVNSAPFVFSSGS